MSQKRPPVTPARPAAPYRSASTRAREERPAQGCSVCFSSVWPCPRSNPRVPLIAPVLPVAAFALRDLLEARDEFDPADVLRHFISQLGFHPKTQRRAVLDR